METITCPECGSHMDYYAYDATCTCVTCLVIYDVWNMGEATAEITMDTSYKHLIKNAKQIEVQ